MTDNEQWVTNDGQRLYVFEMSDAHVTNAKAFLEHRIKNKEYLDGHSCSGYDSSDIGPCVHCDNETDLLVRWEEWIIRFDKDIQRRAADVARQAASGASRTPP